MEADKASSPVKGHRLRPFWIPALVSFAFIEYCDSVSEILCRALLGHQRVVRATPLTFTQSDPPAAKGSLSQSIQPVSHAVTGFNACHTQSLLVGFAAKALEGVYFERDGWWHAVFRRLCGQGTRSAQANTFTAVCEDEWVAGRKGAGGIDIIILYVPACFCCPLPILLWPRAAPVFAKKHVSGTGSLLLLVYARSVT